MGRTVKGRLLPLVTLGRVMRDGENRRIAYDAIKEMAKIITEIIKEISTGAWDIAVNSKRKTIKAKDVRLSYKITRMRYKRNESM